MSQEHSRFLRLLKSNLFFFPVSGNSSVHFYADFNSFFTEFWHKMKGKRIIGLLSHAITDNIQRCACLEKLQFYDLSYKSKNIAIQIVCYSLRSSATMKKQRNIESFEGRNKWAGKVAPGQVCRFHNSRPWFLKFFPARLLCLFWKTKAYHISGILVSTTIDIQTVA